MKKVILLFVFCAFAYMAKAAYPQTLPIDYSSFFATSAMGTDPTLLKDTYADPATNPAILANEWATFPQASYVSPTVEASSLNYSNYTDNNSGKAIVLSPNRFYTCYPLTTGSEYTGKPFYMSALINFSAVRNESFLHFGGNPYGNVSRGKLLCLAVSGGYNLGIQLNGEAIVYAPTLLSFSTTYLVVMKVTPATSGTEYLSLYINPVIGDAEPVAKASTSAAASLYQIKSIVLRATPTGKIAGLRFSDNWADAVKATAAKLTAPTVQNATSITTTGFTANWNTVDNAVGYDVKVYLGANLVSTTNVSGQATSSLVISDLPNGLIYNYKVVAKGNGTTYTDSDLSVAKEVATSTTNNVNSVTTNFGDGTWGTVYTGSYPTNGSYPSSSANGFDIAKGYVRGVNSTGPRNESHTNQILLDYSIYNSMLVFPTLNSVEQIEIHAKSGSDNKGFMLKEFTGNAWTTIGTYTTMNTVESIHIISVSRSVPTKFRIENAFGSGLSIFQIIARTTNPALLPTPTVGTATSISTTGFTANWTAVANASGGYVVRVYEGATLRKTITVTNPAAESVAVTGLITNTTYTYKVSAIGDGGVSYSDSYMSAASEPVTTITAISTSQNSGDLSLTAASNLNVTSGGTLTLNSNVTVNSITVSPGGKLSLNDGNTLTAGSLILESSASGTATFVDNNTADNPASVSGTIQQHIATTGRNWYTSIPVTAATVESLNSTNAVAYWDETKGEWATLTALSPLNPLRGYISAAGSSISFTGTLNSGLKTITLTRTAGKTKEGFNLVGNPYPSYLDWSLVDTTAANIGTSVWYRTKTTGNTYTFDTYNGKANVSTTNGATTVTNLIPPMQAFWVRVKAGQTTGTLTFTNAMRKHVDVAGNKLKSPASPNSDQKVLRLQVSNGTNSDETILLFNPNASDAYDGYDSPKMSNSNVSTPEIYTNAGNEQLVINGLKQITPNLEIPLGFFSGSSQTNNFTLRATEVSNFDATTRIILKDNQNNTETDITNGDIYTFNSGAVNNSSKFSLIFKSATNTTDIQNSESGLLKSVVYCNKNNEIVIDNLANLSDKLTITVANTIGQKLFNTESNERLNTIHYKFRPGLYYVTISGNTYKTTKKVIVK